MGGGNHQAQIQQLSCCSLGKRLEEVGLDGELRQEHIDKILMWETKSLSQEGSRGEGE